MFHLSRERYVCDAAAPQRSPFVRGRSGAGLWATALCLAFLGAANLRAEILTVAGTGEVPVAAASKKDAPAANRAALDAAEAVAVRNGLEVAVATVYGTRERLGSRAADVIGKVGGQAASLVRDTEVRRADVANGMAKVDVVLRVDGQALRDYLRDVLGLSLTEGVEGRFRVYVLTYTVDGQDPDRQAPIVLREEVTDDRNNVQHDKKTSKNASSQAKASAESVQASASSSDQGSVQVKSDVSVKGKASSSSDASVKGKASSSSEAAIKAAADDAFLSARAKELSSASIDARARESSSASIDAKASEAGSANWKRSEAVAIDARASAASSASRNSATSSDEFRDTSTKFHKLVVYADPTKKGAGSSNEVRGKLGEILKGSGFVTAFADVPLMGKTFADEDELYHAVLGEMRARPEVRREDYVAVALNRFTPVPGGTSRFTAQVVYRIVRLGDGELLLPDKVVAADSGEQASDDLARTVATELALRKVDDVLPREVTRAVRQLERADARDAVVAEKTYSIRIENVTSPAATRGLKDALRAAGLGVSTRFRGEAKAEDIDVTLAGKKGDDVVALLEPFLDSFTALSMDSRATVLRFR